MSLYYRALPRLIPQLLLLARPGSEIAIVSPWIDDVTLHPPLFGHGVDRHVQSQIRLSRLLLHLARYYNLRFTLIVRDQDRRFRRAVALLERLQPDALTVRAIPYLHAKALVTETFVIQTSANVLDTSLFRNVESCTLLPNGYGTPRAWLRWELGVII